MTTHVHHPDAAAVEICPRGGWRSQFGHPRGLAGRLAGRLMARKNAPMHRLAVEELGIEPDDRILEIGSGHGRMLRMLAERAPRGFVAGIDPSPAMRAQAGRHCRGLIRAGRVELVEGSVASLPWEEGCFTKVCAVNSFQHWPEPAENLREVHRVLADGGVLLLVLRMHDPDAGRFASPGFRPHQVRAAEELVERSGLRDVRCEMHDAGRRVACVHARK